MLTAAAEDRPVREIARILFLSPDTVRSYPATITKTLDASLRSDAYRLARDNGWI